MFVPGFNLWKRLIHVLRETTTSLVVSGTAIFRQAGGVPGVNEGQVSQSASGLLIESKSGKVDIRVLSGQALRVSQDAVSNSYMEMSAFFCRASNSGGTLIETSADQIRVRSTGAIGFTASSSDAGVSLDAAFTRAGVGMIGGCTLQDSLGVALNTAFTNATTTFANTALARTLLAGVTYKIEGYLIQSNTVGGEGAKFDFNGGTATATVFSSAVRLDGGVSVVLSALASPAAYATSSSSVFYVSGTIKVNAGGTVILRAAKNSTGGGGILTIDVGSWLTFTPLVQV